MSKKLSGAQRRKLQKEVEVTNEAVLKKIPKLTTYFPTSASSSAHEQPLADNTETSLLQENIIHGVNPEQPGERIEISDNSKENESGDTTPSGSGVSECEVSTSNMVEASSIPLPAVGCSDSGILLSNDPGTWPEHLTKGQRDRLILLGPSPLLKSDDLYPLNTRERHFSNVHQFRIKGIKRRWLCYSQSTDSVFCFCCRLFNPMPKSKLGQASGHNDWNHIGRALSDHETSGDHFKCVDEWDEAHSGLESDSSIDKELVNQIRTETQCWHEILKRITAIILYLAEHNLAFRGSSSSLYTKGNGNFLGLVELLGEFDTVMMEHLRQIVNGEQKIQMLSPTIQNELLQIMANQVKQSIIEKIKSAKYFSIIMDCTPDISHKEQASPTIRYVSENQENETVTVEESFIGYSIAEKSTGEALSDLLFQEIEKCGLDMNNCRGQGYDNGANMAGIHKGVQARVLKEYPRSVFTPCGCHSLNLVISDAAKSSVKSTSLFGILQRLPGVPV